MIQTWINVVTQPGEDVFREELHKPDANIGTAVIWIIVAAVGLAIFSAIGSLVSGLIGGSASIMQSLLNSSDIPPEVAAQLAVYTAASGFGVVGAFIGGLIFAPIGFFIGSLIYFAIAKLVGGVGNFEKHTYMLATFTAPIMVVNGAVSIIPFLGGCLSLFIAIYQIVLTYFAMKVTHNLSTGSALIVALTPIIIGLLCAVCVAVGIFALIFGAAASGGNF
jgi:hypothetical protein